MEIILFIIGLVCVIVGFFGSFLPGLPGIPIAAVAIGICYFSECTCMSLVQFTMLMSIGILVTIIDYLIPIWGTKTWGGTKYGMRGATIGLILSVLFPIFGLLGMILAPLLGAFVGEMIQDRKDYKKGIKSAAGSFVGFLLGSGLKMMVCLVYGYYFTTLFGPYALRHVS